MWFDIFLKVWNKKEHLIIYVVFFKSTLWWRIWGSYKYHTTNMHCSFRLLIVLLQMFFLNHTYPFCYRHHFFLDIFFFCTTQIHSHTACSSSEQMTHEHMNMPFTWKICMQNGSGNGNQNLLQKIERTDSCKSVKIKLRQSKIKVKHTKKNWPE